MKFSNRTSYIDISGIRKMFELSSGKDIINLGLGEPDFPISEESKKAISKAVEDDFTHYTPGKGIPELRGEIAKRISEGGLYSDPENIIVTSGASEALEISLLALLDEGDEVLVPDPGFVSYRPLTRIAGGVPTPYGVYEKDSFEPLPESVREKISQRARAIILNSPGNPTGAVSKERDVREIAEIAVENDLFIVSDEVYERLIYEGSNHSPGRYSDNSIVVNSFSKTYAMTGLRLGYVSAREEIIEEMLKIHQYVQASTCSLSQAAAVSALRSGEDYTDGMRKELRIRRDLMVDLLREIEGVSCVRPRGAFYVFANFSDYGGSGELSMKILKDAKVIVTPGTAFGENGEGYLRFSFGTSREKISEGIERIKRLLSKD